LSGSRNKQTNKVCEVKVVCWFVCLFVSSCFSYRTVFVSNKANKQSVLVTAVCLCVALFMCLCVGWLVGVYVCLVGWLFVCLLIFVC
jgi:hypothetical protein